MVFQRKFIVAFVLVFGIAGFATLGRNGVILALESRFFSFIGIVGKPIFSLAEKVGDVRQGVLHYREVVEENKSLRDQYRAAVEKLGIFEETQKENESLREAIGFHNELGRSVIPAHVAGLFRDVNQEVIMVDKGREDGVVNGSVVIGKNHVVVGRIIEAYAETAKVLLATSPSEKFDVVFAGTPLRVIAQGESAGEFTLGLVPADASIADGDVVLVSHAHSVYPPGFTVGTVSRIRESASRVFRDVRVRSLFDPYQEEMVYILP